MMLLLLCLLYNNRFNEQLSLCGRTTNQSTTADDSHYLQEDLHLDEEGVKQLKRRQSENELTYPLISALELEEEEDAVPPTD